MRAYRRCLLCIIISAIVLAHTIRAVKELSVTSFVQQRIESRLSVKNLLDLVGCLLCILFWAFAFAVRIRKRDLTESQYKTYYITSTVLWQLLVVPYVVISAVHSVYLMVILLDDAGYIQGETANHLRSAFNGLSSQFPD
ncbi:unnamed protein product, partial [Dicrocoelium dendriticum]